MTPPARRAARVLMALTALVGLWAMHGLSRDHALPAAYGMAMQHPAAHGTVVHGVSTHGASAHGASAAGTVLAPPGDGHRMHSECVAAPTRQQPTVDPVATAVPVGHHEGLHNLPGLVIADGVRAPPDVSLVRLCVSRT